MPNREISSLASVVILAATMLPSQAVAAQGGAQANTAQPLTKAQFAAQLDANFKSVDSNGDKILSAAEIEAAQSRAAAQAQANIAKRLETEFNRLDANKDGQLSPAEFKAGAPVPRVTPAAQMLQQFDRNKNGKVEQEEFRAVPLANFDRIDTNKDGTISIEEQGAAGPRR